MKVRRIGITIGDPAGVGPELMVKISKDFEEGFAYYLYADEFILKRAFEVVGLSFDYKKIEAVSGKEGEGIYLVDFKIFNSKELKPSLSCAKVGVSYLAISSVDALNKKLDGLLTMPINKFWAKKVGFSFNGQTQYLARVFGVEDYLMSFISEDLKVCLLTDHVPLREALSYINRENLYKKLKLANEEFKKIFGFEPKIGVLGLNPHAGEFGEIGKEDVEVILFVVDKLKEEGLNLEGPLPPDSAFFRDYDLFFCLYHDQGLIPFKLKHFKDGVHTTFGFPILRASPVHGTAYEVAWKNLCDETSARKALRFLQENTS